MDNIHQYIIDQLAAHIRPNDIILEVQQATGMDWDEARRLVEDVQLEHGTEVSRRQWTLILTLEIASMLSGLWFVISGANSMAQFAVAYSPGGLSPMMLIGAIFSTMGTTNYFIGQIMIGLALIIGSYLGMRKTWAAILERILTKQ